MTGIKKIISDSFWSVLQEIDSLDGDCPLQHFKGRFDDPSITDDLLFEVVTFLKKFNYPVAIKKKSGMPWLVITGERKLIKFDMSFSNWLALQAHVPFVKELKDRLIQNNLKECLSEIEKRYPEFDLSRGLERPRRLSVANPEKQNYLKLINEATDNEKVIFAKAGDKKYECFAHRMIYVDGVLTFIGEDIGDRCLVSFDFNEMSDVSIFEEKSYQANFTPMEIDDFIYAIRTITGNEERIVLKVTAPEKVNLKPDYQFLGSPYMTTNADGDFIWAASIEVSEELFSWLYLAVFFYTCACNPGF